MGEAALFIREATSSLQVVGTWQHVLLYRIGKHDSHLKQDSSLITSSQMTVYTTIISDGKIQAHKKTLENGKINFFQ
jgi:hypothetical protein